MVAVIGATMFAFERLVIITFCTPYQRPDVQARKSGYKHAALPSSASPIGGLSLSFFRSTVKRPATFAFALGTRAGGWAPELPDSISTRKR